MATISYGTFTIIDESDGSQFWTSTVAPVSPDYTFIISDLVGDTNADIKVGDIILYSHYRYTVLGVDENGTTVLTGNRESLRGIDGISPSVKSLDCSNLIVVRRKNGLYNPELITFKGKSQREDIISDYFGWFVVEMSSDTVNWVTVYETSASQSESVVEFNVADGASKVTPTTQNTNQTTLLTTKSINIDGTVNLDGDTQIMSNGNVYNKSVRITSKGVISKDEDEQLDSSVRLIRCSLYSSSNFDSRYLVDRQIVGIVFDGLNGTDGEDGVDGRDGKDGLNGKDGINGVDGKDGVNGKDGINGKDGENGKDGVDGKDGKDGLNSYVHIKYSSVSNPTDAQMTEIPSDYIGICTDNNINDPTTASSYIWSRWSGKDGKDGLPGKAGEDGTSTYVHFAYANSADGKTDFSVTPFTGAKYVGVRTDTTQTDSINPSDYEWSDFKGEKGDKGASIVSIVEYYAVTSTTDVPPDSAFSPNVQSPTATAPYLWNYEQIIFSDDTSNNMGKHILMTYNQGDEGRGIASVTEYYAINNSTTAPADSAFSTVIKNVSATNKYLWNYEVIAYTDGLNPTITGKRIIGTYGDKGDQGIGGYTVFLTNSNHTFSGSTRSAINGQVDCGIIAYKGETQLPSHIVGITGAPTGMTATIIKDNAVDASFRVSVTNEMTTRNGVLDVQVSVDGKIFNLKFSYSLQLNGLDSTGLGWKVNYSSLDNQDNGECYYYGFDEATKEPSDAEGVNAWVLWNGEEVTIPTGCHINPNQTMPFNTTIYNVYRTSTGTFHDVVWIENKNIWRSNTYREDIAYANTDNWVWNEATDIILAMYVEPSNEGKITNAQLFTPPKKYSELAESAKEIAKEAEKVALHYMVTESSTGTMIADMTDEIERLPSNIPSGYKNILITGESLKVRDGQDVLASYGDAIILGKENANNVSIDSNGVSINDGNKSLASYGESVRIGQNNNPHLEVTSSGMSAYKNGTDKYYEMGDGSDNVVQTYNVLELPLTITLKKIVEDVLRVTVNDVNLTMSDYEYASGENTVDILNRSPSAIKVDIEYTYATGDEEDDILPTETIIETFNYAAVSIAVDMDYTIDDSNDISVTSVHIGDNELIVNDDYTIDSNILNIKQRPVSGSVISIYYHLGMVSPYFTFNKRKDGSHKGNSSVSFADGGTASGDSSFAIGINTNAIGIGSFSGGNNSTSNGAYSSAIGDGVVSNHIGAFSCGTYNAISSADLFSIGNGTAKNRSSAFRVTNSGDATAYGDLQVKGRALIHGQMRGGVKNGGYIGMFSTKSFTKTVGSISVNGASTGLTLNITRNGYYPIAVSGIRILNKSGGSNASRCNVYIYKIVNNANESHITFSIANLGSANATGVKVEFTVFYIARNAVLGE